MSTTRRSRLGRCEGDSSKPPTRRGSGARLPATLQNVKMTSAPHLAALPHEDAQRLLEATGRQDPVDALHWIAEGRRIAGGVTDKLLTALVVAADLGLQGADQALRTATQSALRSTLDTSADLVLTDTIVPAARYESALAAVAARTPTRTLSSIGARAVGAAQAVDPLVIETLGLVAGLSWRDLGDRSSARGIQLPGESTGPWSAAQVESAFTIVDEVVRGHVVPQLEGAEGARPMELLLARATAWEDVESLRTQGVSYGTLLAQRDVGSAWSAHRNRTNNEISRLIVLRVLAELDRAGVRYWALVGQDPVPRSFLSGKVVKGGKGPGQLSVVTRRTGDQAGCAVLVAVARDGGTARKTAATLLKLPQSLEIPAALVLMGTGWAGRGESDGLVRAFAGRVYTEHTLPALAVMATELSDAADTIEPPESEQEIL